MRVLVCAAALALATASQAAVLIDFGTNAGQMNTGNAWTGGSWNGTHTAAYTPDTLQITYNMTGDWQAAGINFGGWGGSYLQTHSPFSGLDTSQPLQMLCSFTAPAGMSFNVFQIMITGLSGSESDYRFMASPWPWTSSAPLSSTMQLVSATTAMNAPYSTAGTGAFNWSTDTIDQIKFQFQNATLANGNPGPNTGAVLFEVNNIQASVPEPTICAGLGIASLGLVLRKRQK